MHDFHEIQQLQPGNTEKPFEIRYKGNNAAEAALAVCRPLSSTADSVPPVNPLAAGSPDLFSFPRTGQLFCSMCDCLSLLCHM